MSCLFMNIENTDIIFPLLIDCYKFNQHENIWNLITYDNLESTLKVRKCFIVSILEIFEHVYNL